MGTPRRHQLVHVLVIASAGGIALTGCSGVRVEVQETAAQMACQEYAQALINGGSREAVTAGMERALSTARSDSTSEAQSVANAIEAVLTQSVMGTNESVMQANDRVIRACDGAGVTLEMVE